MEKPTYSIRFSVPEKVAKKLKALNNPWRVAYIMTEDGTVHEIDPPAGEVKVSKSTNEVKDALQLLKQDSQSDTTPLVITFPSKRRRKGGPGK